MSEPSQLVHRARGLTEAPPPAAPDSEPAVTLGAERALAIEHWLLSAAEDPDRARTDWKKSGRALLRCGTLFAAVRLSARIVYAAAQTACLQDVDSYLARALHGGPAFLDQLTHRYYVLVGASTGCRPQWSARRSEDAELIGRAHFLGIPPVQSTTPGAGPSYWCVPMDSPGDLCAAGAVEQLLAYGRYNLTAQELS
ncbi:hypothetical protein ACFYOF_44700 [Streptomyces sp. NPDC007148]|uniref:hypothetical protein n=1 Tax=Streptomyces sp. NPDC007148 TaxID=3364775 RepID=UPI00368027D8